MVSAAPMTKAKLGSQLPEISKNDITLQVVLDKYGKTFEKFGGTTLPLLVVIDKKGNISYSHTGYVPGDEKELKKHLLAL